jgi:predicted lipoprotein
MLAIGAALLVAMALGTTVVPIDQVKSDVFSPAEYGKKDFPRIQAAIETAAVDAAELAAAIAADKAAAAEKYGKPGSVGPIFPVKFTGVVGEGSSGVFKVKVEGMPEGSGIRVQTGPAINGTEVRDATGTVDFGQFTNQIEYQDAGSALNNEVKAQVIGELDREKLPGKTVEVVGAFQLINPANWMVTPVRFKVMP